MNGNQNQRPDPRIFLTDKPASGEYRADNTAKTGKIARADVADFLDEQVSDKRYLRQAISVSS